MLIEVQSKYKEQLISALKEIDRDAAFFSLQDNSPGDLIIGDIEYLEAHLDSGRGKSAFIMVADDKNILASRLHQASVGRRFYVADNAAGEIGQILSSIKNKVAKSQQISEIKAEIQSKRRDLEQLNDRLSSESERKIQSLERSHIEESEKNQNEKSLLHFLDFIQTESVSYDFLEKLFRFMWKDLKKNARLNLIGLSMTTQSGKSKILFFDGHAESTTLAGPLHFSGEGVSTQLATAWGRPVGRILSWQLPEISRESYLFLEIVDQQTSREKINNYFAERMAMVSMYVDRWMIEKEIEVVLDRWQNTFRSFPGFTHVVDENFHIYQSNYSGKSGELCYKVLAGRETPCENCPIIKNRNTTLVLKNDTTVKTYFSQFKFQFRKFYFVIYEDVTKMNLLHSHIIQTEKMSTLGRLGNHLAHELNNPLAGIKSYVQTLLDDKSTVASLPSTATSDLNEILKATVRCQKIIKNFIDFSQKKEPSLEKVNFLEVLQNTIVLLKTALRSHRLFIDLQNDVVQANAHDLQQVLFNLIKNSCQAMVETGSIKIYREEKDSKLFFHIEDTGSGFDESILKNIFQPFMTTKPQGEGTGLGLYLSKKLMNNMGADLQIGPASQKGAKISLIFDKI